MVLLASSYDQSKYLRAEDVTKDKPLVLKIKKCTEDMVGQGADQQQKLVVWFDNSKKGLVLNRTNNRTIRGAYGDDVADWTGKKIVLFQSQEPFRGRVVPAVRVRLPLKSNPNITSDKPKPVVEAADEEPELTPEPKSDDPDFDDKVEF